jgi:hypothetical protein
MTSLWTIVHLRLFRSFLLALGALTLLLPAASASAKTSSGTRMVRCMQTAAGHTPSTKSGIADCNGMPLIRHRCPGGGVVIVLKLGGSTVALRPGQKPVRLGASYTTNRLNTICKA